MTTNFPPLYKKSAASGKVNCWKVSVQGDTITVEQGQVGGATQTYPTTCEGKNLGRSNETSPSEQAILEAQSKWNKQVKKGYVQDSSGGGDILLPMKVSTYQGNEQKVVFPCILSPKLNGVNAEARLLEDGSIVLLSRGGEEYLLPPHWEGELREAFSALNTTSLNGEVYKHGEWLQDITGAMKKPNKLTEELEFHIFDLPCSSENYDYRSTGLGILFGMFSFTYLKEVDWFVAENHKHIENFHKTCVEDGYEGIIIRNLEGLYRYNTRSNDVFKYKVALSEEFKITSYFEDKLGHAVFWCESKGGIFKAKPKGTDAHRKAIRAEADEWIGKYMTVEFESYSKGGKPTKPVGIGLRKGEWNEETEEFIPSE